MSSLITASLSGPGEKINIFIFLKAISRVCFFKDSQRGGPIRQSLIEHCYRTPSHPDWLFFLSQHVALHDSSEEKVTFKKRDIHLNDSGTEREKERESSAWIKHSCVYMCVVHIKALALPGQRVHLAFFQCISIHTHTQVHTGLLLFFVVALILASSCDPSCSVALMFWLDAISLVSPQWCIIIYCCRGTREDTLINQYQAILPMLSLSPPHMGSAAKTDEQRRGRGPSQITQLH